MKVITIAFSCFSSLLFIAATSYASYLEQAGKNIDGFIKDPKGTIEGELPSDKDLWGRAGSVAMPAAEKIMKERNSAKEPLSERLKYALRPIFGDLVDQVNIHYSAKMMDKWSAAGHEINLSGEDTVGQAYGYDVFIAYPASRFDSEPADMISLVIHEITHVQQMRDIKNTVADFGYSYFFEYKAAGLNYENNQLEISADNNANQHYEAAYRRYEEFSGGQPSGQNQSIVSQRDGLCLYTDNYQIENKARVVPCDGGGQKGRLWKYDIGNLYIISARDGGCLYTDDYIFEGNVRVVPCDRGGKKGRQWKLDSSNGSIVSERNGYCLYTDDYQFEGNVRVVPCDRGGRTGRQWKLQ